MTVTKYGSIAASITEADESGLNDSLNTSLFNPILGAKSSIVSRNRKLLGKQNTCTKRKTKHQDKWLYCPRHRENHIRIDLGIYDLHKFGDTDGSAYNTLRSMLSIVKALPTSISNPIISKQRNDTCHCEYSVIMIPDSTETPFISKLDNGLMG